MLLFFKKNIFFFVQRSFFTFTNSVDPDEMQHYTVFHLSLHCLQKYSFRGFPNTKLTLHLFKKILPGIPSVSNSLDQDQALSSRSKLFAKVISSRQKSPLARKGLIVF